VSGRNLAAIVLETGRPARLDYHESDAMGAIAADARISGIGCSVGAPISVEGRVWGVISLVSTGEEPLPMAEYASRGLRVSSYDRGGVHDDLHSAAGLADQCSSAGRTPRPGRRPRSGIG
jgi:GAF domain